MKDETNRVRRPMSLVARIRSAANHIYLRMQHKLKLCLPGGVPISAMVELSSLCNLKCALCPAGNGELNRKAGFMPKALFKRIVDELDDRYTRELTPVMWGESLIHPDFIEMMEYAGRKSWKISVSTNGNIKGDDDYFDRLVACGVDEILCSVDGHDEESYVAYRQGGSLSTVHEFLRKVKEARDRAGAELPRVIVQILLFSSTEKNLDEIKEAVSPYADKVRTKPTRNFYTDENKINEVSQKRNELKPENEEYKYPGRPTCPSMLYYININWEGDVLACCKDPQNIIRFGNIKDRSMKQIRKSKEFRDMKEKLLRGDSDYDICRSCCLN